MNYKENRKEKTVAFITLGCKVNQYETNAMAQKLIKKGYKIVEHNQKADIYIINTCTVTNMSDRKSRQMIRRAKETNPQAKIMAVGCYVQVARKEIENIEEIDLVLGNEEKVDIAKYCDEILEKQGNEKEQAKIAERVEQTKTVEQAEVEELAKKLERVKPTDLKDVMHTKEFAEFGEITYTEKTRAVIKVQDGCDRFCSYCIIPYARGRVRSRKPQNVVHEITEIAKKGIKEVVITGIHIASYGKDFKEDDFKEKGCQEKDSKEKNTKERNSKEKYELIDLLEEINKIEGIQRIRLGSIEPLLITEEFVQRLSKLEKICEHFHLSLQSGCNETLKRMNRRYTTEQFKEITERLRKTYPNVNLTTDIIVGFPGETEAEFEKTYQFLKEIKFYKMHIFKYSPRKGTKAAEMKEQVPPEIKEERSKKLIELSDKNEKEYNQKYVGKEVEVLWEEEKNGVYKGHTKNYVLVELMEQELGEKMEHIVHVENTLETVRIEEAEEHHIIAKKTNCNKNVIIV